MFLLIPLFLTLTVLLLISSKDALALASMGLTVWFENMIPTLLPFMILSGIMTGLNLQYDICKPFHRLTQKLFSVDENGTYCIVMGFLCGFPMGAFCTAQLCQQHLLSPKQAQYLVAFCNNIGPVYFYSFALSMIGFTHPDISQYLILTIGMYGIPLIYGIMTRPLKATKNLPLHSEPKNIHLFHAIDRSINRSGTSILRLCGYMVLFNILMLPCYRLLGNGILPKLLHCFMEISGGIRMLHPHVLSENHSLIQLIMLTALSFGGLSCIGQTSVFLNEADLSISKYVKSRVWIAFVAFLFYASCFITGLL